MKRLASGLRATWGLLRHGGPGSRRTLTNSGFALGATGVTAVTGLVETIVLAHFLSPHGLGIFVLLIAYPEAVQQLLDFRVRDGMTRYLTGFLAQDRKREAVAIVKLLWLLDVVVSGVALVIVVLTAGIAAGLLLHDAERGGLMVIYSLGLFFGSLDTASGPVLRAVDRFGLSFTCGSVCALGRLALVTGVLVAGGGLGALVWARVGAELLTTLLQGSVTLHVLAGLLWDERRTPITVLRGRFGEIGRFLVNTNLAGVLRTASSKLDTILVGSLATPATVGLYRIASQFGRLPLLVSDSLYTVVFPSFARAFAQERWHDMRQLAIRVSLFLGAISLPTAAFAALEGGPLMAFVAGDAYRGAGLAFAICLAGITPYVVFSWCQPLILTGGHAGALVRMAAVATAAQLIAIALLVPEFGASGATSALALMYLLTVMLQLDFVRRKRLFVSTDPTDRHDVPAPTSTATG